MIKTKTAKEMYILLKSKGFNYTNNKVTGEEFDRWLKNKRSDIYYGKN